MNKEKACRNCRYVIEEGTTVAADSKCPNCNESGFTTFWRGYVIITKPEESDIAKKMGITRRGKFALRLSR